MGAWMKFRRELLRADPSLVEPARGRPELLLEAATDGRSEIGRACCWKQERGPTGVTRCLR